VVLFSIVGFVGASVGAAADVVRKRDSGVFLRLEVDEKFA
jgi:hypothetical protein